MTTPARQLVATRRGRWYGGAGGYGMIRCPAHDDKEPSCRVRDGESGVTLVSCYGGCDRLVVIDQLKKDGDWPAQERQERPRARGHARRRYAPPCPPMPPARSLSGDEKQRVDFAGAIWDATVGAFGTIIDRYWHEARGLTLPIPDVIRFGASVPYGYRPGAQRYPAMVAMVQGPDGSFAGVHATFLLANGSDKRRDLPNDRLVFGCVGGGAVRLAPAVDEIAIGEGIESTASYMQEFGVAGWATMNTSGLRNVILPAPPLAFAVTLLGENDDAKGKQKVLPSAAAIEAATARLRIEGRLVGSVFPAEEFKDFNDPHKRIR